MHGEARHLAEHAKLARAAGVEEVLDVRNGEMVRLAPGAAEIIDEAPVGRLFRDGDLLVPSRRTGRCASAARWRSPASSSSRWRGRASGEVLADAEIALDGVPTADAEGRPMLDIVRDAVEGTIAAFRRDRRKDGGDGARGACAAPCARPWRTPGASGRSPRCC